MATAFDADIAIIGAGPTAAAAAGPLVRSGRKILWLDAGRREPQPSVPGASLAMLAASDETLRALQLGDEISVHPSLSSPKLRAPGMRRFLETYSNARIHETENFHLVGSWSMGGLSNLWGAMTPLYDRDELALPVALWNDLEAFAAALAAEIGVSGRADTDPRVPVERPAPLDPAFAALWERVERKGVQAPISFDLPRQAVLGADRADRKACTGLQRCLWGCPTGSVYSAAHVIEPLIRHDNVDYRSETRVLRIRREAEGFTILTSNAEGAAVLRAHRIVLASGAVQSTVLALDCAPSPVKRAALGTTPAFSFAALLHDHVGKPVADHGFGMAQLSWSVGATATRSREAIHGGLFSIASLPSLEIARLLPLSKAGGLEFLRSLGAGLAFGNGFLPSAFGRSTIEVIDRAEGPHARIVGEHAAECKAEIRSVMKALRGGLQGLGASVFPGSVRMAEPGLDIHYGATLPMLGDAPHATDALGQLEGAPGLHVVDTAILPRMSSRSPTFTAMANARRIGAALAA